MKTNESLNNIELKDATNDENNGYDEVEYERRKIYAQSSRRLMYVVGMSSLTHLLVHVMKSRKER